MLLKRLPWLLFCLISCLTNNFICASDSSTSSNGDEKDISIFENLKIWNSFIKIFPLLDTVSTKSHSINKQLITNEIIQLISGEQINDNDNEEEDVDQETKSLNKQVYKLLYDETPIIANMFRLYYKLPLPTILNKSLFKEPQFFLNGEKHSLDEIYYLKSDQLQKPSDFIKHIDQPVIKMDNSDGDVVEKYDSASLVELHCELDDEFFELFVMEAIDGKFDLIWFDTSNITSSPKKIDKEFDPNSLYEVKYEDGKKAVFNGSKVISDSIFTEKQRKNKKGFLYNLDLTLCLDAISKHEQDPWASLDTIFNDINEVVLQDKQQEKQRVFNLEKNDILADKEKIKSELNELKQSGISYDNLGLYINGIPMQFSHLSKYGLMETLVEELISFEGLKNAIRKVFPQMLSVSVESVKQILLEYGIMSQKLALFNQPRKFNLMKTDEESDCVLFVNDLENDEQYESLPDDLTLFLESNHEKEFPSIKENWNDIVFVLNLDNENMITDFVRVINVISNGFPQRIGFIPMTDDLDLLNKILQVYNNPVKLSNLLIDQDSISVQEELIEEASNLKSRIHTLINKMNIEDPEALIVNGEIFPFRSNSWNYYITTVMNKDIQFIKSYLRTLLNNGEALDHDETKLRDILYSEAFPFIERDLTFTPDYFGDSAITRTNYDFILEFRELGAVFEFTKNTEYEIIHVLTLVADFSDISEWKNIYNLMQNELYGMKIRLITLTDPKDKNWLKLLDLVLGDQETFLKYIEQKSSKKNFTKKKLVKQTVDFSDWLLDLSYPQLQSTRFAVLNGRFLNLANMPENISKQLWFNFMKFESFKTLQGIAALDIALRFQEQEMIPMQTMEDIISYLSFYSHKDLAQGKETHRQGIHYSAETVQVRQPVNKILSYIEAEKNFDLFLNSKNFQKESIFKPIDITLVIDPIDEVSSKIIDAVKFLKPLKKMINLQILLLPTLDLAIFPRQTLFVKGKDLELVKFENKNDFEITKIPEIQSLESHKSDNTDVFINGEAYIQKALNVVRGSSRMVVETDISNVCIKIVTDNEEEEITRFSSMSTFGYSLFKVNANETRLLKFVSCDPDYKVTEFSLDINSDFSAWINFKVSDLLDRNVLIHIEENKKVEEDEEKETKNVTTDSLSVLTILNNSEDLNKLKILFRNKNNKYYIWNSKGSNLTKEDIEKTVPKGYNCEVINAEWASWMRPTNIIKNQLNYAKYMLVDLLLPLSVDKLVFVDLNDKNNKDWLKIVEQGDKEMIMDSDKDDFVLGLIPHEETDDSYWKTEEYFKEFMKTHNLEDYYQTKNYIMSLKNYRLHNTGDILRVHYQRLTTDVNSLKQFDEALINNVQPQLSITKLQFHSLNDKDYDLDEL